MTKTLILNRNFFWLERDGGSVLRDFTNPRILANNKSL